ncbi:hypothetical protein BDZ91DRAFT_20474 [Kalaharituber pfeilii]|nr:hypothetical protein BDZ91DRAFT_20474 [Kalaharituber pfeilii]
MGGLPFACASWTMLATDSCSPDKTQCILFINAFMNAIRFRLKQLGMRSRTRQHRVLGNRTGNTRMSCCIMVRSSILSQDFFPRYFCAVLFSEAD